MLVDLLNGLRAGNNLAVETKKYTGIQLGGHFFHRLIHYETLAVAAYQPGNAAVGDEIGDLGDRDGHQFLAPVDQKPLPVSRLLLRLRRDAAAASSSMMKMFMAVENGDLFNW